MNKQEIIQMFCKLCADVQEALIKEDCVLQADCFCTDSKFSTPLVEKKIINFINDAVQERITLYKKIRREQHEK